MTFSTARCIFAALTVNALTLTSAIAQGYPTGSMVGAYYPPVNSPIAVQIDHNHRTGSTIAVEIDHNHRTGSTIAVDIDHNHRVAGGGTSPILYNPYRN